MTVLINGTTGITTPGLTNEGSQTISTGTANGVPYLNGSKVLTSGSALVFDGSTLGVSTAAGLLANLNSTEANGPYIRFQSSGTSVGDIGTAAQVAGGSVSDFAINARGTGNLVFARGFSEQMRLTSTGLGIGTSSPDAKLVIANPATGVPTLKLSGFADGTAGIPYAIINFYNEDGSQAGPNNAAAIKALNASSDGSGGQLAFYTALSNASEGSDALERMRLDSSGNLLVGTTSTLASSKFYVEASANVAYFRSTGVGTAGVFRVDTLFSGTGTLEYFQYGSTEVGKITTNGTNTTYSTSSDYRLKKDIAPMTNALAKVAQLKPVTYKWKSNGSFSEGFIAHELQSIIPDAVVGEKDAVNEDGSIKPQGIDTSFLVATLTAAIQEQQAIITALTARVTALEGN